MADTSVAITAGAGTLIDTRTESTNSNHRQVVVIGDPATNAGVAPVDVVKGLAVDLTASGALPTVTNLSQLGGAAVAMGTGVRSAGTQRVTIATDDLVPVNGTVSANVLLAGTTPDVGSGTGGSKTQRVIVDSSQLSALGQAAMAASAPVVIASNQTAVPISNTPLTNFGAGEYETVAASQTDQILGATGAVGDYLAGILITPTTTGAGSVSIKDGNGSSIAIFNTGTLSNLVPFYVPLGMITVNGTTPGWKVTTGANVTVIGIGNFT